MNNNIIQIIFKNIFNALIIIALVYLVYYDKLESNIVKIAVK